MLDILTRAETIARPWADLYNGSNALQVAVTFAHIGALVVAGGFAIAADRATLRAVRGSPTAREMHLSELGAVHRPVLIGLALSFVSGVLLFGADVATYGPSLVFWAKMALVAALLVNGALLRHAEERARLAGAESGPLWTPLRRRALASVGLWLTITLFGTILPTLSTVPTR